MYFNYFFSDPNDCLTPLSMQALPDAPESLCIAEMGGNNGIFLISFHSFVKLKSKLLYFFTFRNRGPRWRTWPTRPTLFEYWASKWRPTQNST